MTVHKDRQEMILPDKLPMRKGGKLVLFALVCAATVGFGFASFGGRSPASAESREPARETDVEALIGAVHEAVQNETLAIEVERVRPNGIDSSKCAALPYDGSTTCKAGQVGQKFARVNGRFVRITCGDCIAFSYPTNKQDTVRFTAVEGGAR